jgi:hypothetical protein
LAHLSFDELIENPIHQLLAHLSFDVLIENPIHQLLAHLSFEESIENYWVLISSGLKIIRVLSFHILSNKFS